MSYTVYYDLNTFCIVDIKNNRRTPVFGKVFLDINCLIDFTIDLKEDFLLENKSKCSIPNVKLFSDVKQFLPEIFL